MQDGSVPETKLYWRIWLVLLGLSLLMVVVDQSAAPRVLLGGVLIAAMLVKATLIGGYFMHLRFERKSLIWMVVLSLLLLGTILFVLLIPDGMRGLSLATYPSQEGNL